MVDASTMAVGLEARVPFTDHRLVQLAFDLPLSKKLRWRSPLARLQALVMPVERFSEHHDITKAVLRDVYLNRLPNKVIHRKKMGFPLPLGAWLAKRDGAAVRNILFGANARLHELINPKALQSWFERHAPRASDGFGQQLWLLCNLEIFLQEYF